MNDVARRLMISISTSIILISAISIIPQLVQESWINPVDGVLIALPLSLLIVYIAMKFGRPEKVQKIRLGIFLIASSLFYIFLGSIVYLFSAHGSDVLFLLLLQIDAAILAIPAYLIYKIGKPSELNPGDFSKEYTERLYGLLANPQDRTHSVYISRKAIKRSFAETSNGNDWQVLLKEEAIRQLEPVQLDAVLLDAYFSRKMGVAKKLLLGGSAYVITSIDLIIVSFILINLVSSPDPVFLLISMAVGVSMIPAIPFFILSLTQFLQSRADKYVVKYLTNYEPFTEAIRKKSSLMVPLRPMTWKQQMRYEKRISRITEKRISRIKKLGSESGKT